MFSSDKAF